MSFIVQAKLEIKCAPETGYCTFNYERLSGLQTLDFHFFNPLTPNDPYRGRTAPLTSKVAFYIFIQQI